MKSFSVPIQGYLDHCTVSDRSQTTVVGKRSRLEAFHRWCLKEGFRKPADIRPPDLDRYKAYLYMEYRSRSGRQLDVATRRTHLTDVKQFFYWMKRAGKLAADPALDLDLPRVPRRLRQVWLVPEEAEQILARAGRNARTGLRDKAMLEVLWATGIRRKELIGLDIGDIDFSAGTLKVRAGKGGHERYVPIAGRACHAVQLYLRELRPKLATLVSGEALFLDRDGNRFQPQRLSRFVKQYVARSGVTKRGACNMYRHSTATLMLDGGADIRHVQEMLGHADISTTMVYTHVALESLKRVYSRTHPAAKGAAEREAPPA